MDNDSHDNDKKSLLWHSIYRGKMGSSIECPVRGQEDFSIWYSPGVAAACEKIYEDPEQVYQLTNKGNTIAIVSDGSRVLGLGDIGPEAALPVMEGKALLFKYLGGVDSTSLCLNTRDTVKIIETVKFLQPSFGGVNLEDIAQPKCFPILKTLQEQCHIPVWHDDQQGTATVTVAGLLGALEVVGKPLDEVAITLVGAGAANVRIAHLLMKAGASPGMMVVCDSKGILHEGRQDLSEVYPEKWELCQLTNEAGLQGGVTEAMREADVVIALSKPGPGVITREQIALMADDPIVFACANPVPEIWPEEAYRAGAAVVATGRSDFPNQVNNSLCFPALFRGVLDVRARQITDEMCLAAAYSLVEYARENGGISKDHIIPSMQEWEVYPFQAARVGQMAIRQAVAREHFEEKTLYNMAHVRIKQEREKMQWKLKKGIIKAPPP